MKLRGKFLKFMWRPTEWSRRSECYNDLEQGGLGVLDIITRVMSYWIKEMLELVEFPERLNSASSRYWLAMPPPDYFKLDSLNILGPKAAIR